MNKNIAHFAKDSIVRTCIRHRVLKLAKELLNDERFYVCSGSSKPEQHHYGDHGLLIHTEEVITYCFQIASSYEGINYQELLLSALFHDAGKMYDYEKLNIANEDNWKPTEHKYKIHHLPRSVIIWNLAAHKHKLDEKLIDNVTHNILAHHGLKEWGSPVRPQTKEAWILHLCDSLSARLDEV